MTDLLFFQPASSLQELDYHREREVTKQWLIAEVMAVVNSSIATKNPRNTRQSTEKCHPDVGEYGHK